MPYDLKLGLSGLVVGILVGLTGMGGGSLMTPILILMGLPPVKAVGTDIAYSAVTKSFGAWRHHTLKNVDYRLAFWMAAGSVPSAVLGVMTLSWVQDNVADPNKVVKLYLGVALMLVGATLLYRTLHNYSKPTRVRETTELTINQKALAVGVGIVFGYLLGLTSVGSGVFFGMVLLTIFALPASKVVGTDIFHASMLIWAAALAHAAYGNVIFGDVGALLIGSIPGILIGSQYTNKVPEKPLRCGLAVVLAVSGFFLVHPPH